MVTKRSQKGQLYTQDQMCQVVRTKFKFLIWECNLHIICVRNIGKEICWVVELLSTGHRVDIIKGVVCYLLMDITKLGSQMFLENRKKFVTNQKKSSKKVYPKTWIMNI